MYNRQAFILLAFCLICCIPAAAAAEEGIEQQISRLRLKIKEEKSVIDDLKLRHGALMAATAADDPDCSARAPSGEVLQSRSDLDLELVRMQRASLEKQRGLIEEKIARLYRRRIALEARKLAEGERQLSILLALRRQQAPAPGTTVVGQRQADSGDAAALGEELDALLAKQKKLMLKGLSLEKEFIKAAGR